MPTGARLILAIDLGLAVVLVLSIVVQAFRSFRQQRHPAVKE